MQFIRGPLQFVHRTLERIAVLPLGRQRLSKHALEEALPRVLDPMNPNVRDPNGQRLVLIHLRRTLAGLFGVPGRGGGGDMCTQAPLIAAAPSRTGRAPAPGQPSRAPR